MNLKDIAHAYVRSVELEEKARSDSSEFAEELAELRSELHAIFMDTLRQSKIPFADRRDAARIAFELAKQSVAGRSLKWCR